MRIDQMMSFAWKILIPLMFLQVLLNGLVLVYDWPKLILTVTGLALIVAASFLVRRAVLRTTRSPREQRLEAMRIRAARGVG